MSQSPSDSDLKQLGELICEQAFTFFAECGEPDDFCVQYVGQVAVFGGTNRLIWSPLYGWRPDRSYCRESFLKQWDEKHGQVQ